jgi:TP901 family phage tail tape measure protein
MATQRSDLLMTLTDRITGPMKRLNAGLERFHARNQQLAAGLIPGGSLRGLVGAYAGYATLTAGIRGTIGASMAFESAFADVAKVVNTNEAGLARLRAGLIGMSKEIPVSVEGLAEIQANAAQGGIAVRDLDRFTRFAAKSSVALGISAGEIGDTYAKLANVFQLNQRGIEDLADGANHLSNNMATTAANVLDFTNRAAGAAKALNLTVAELQALGGATTASGIVAETAARGVSALSTKLATGGPKIERAFRTMGWSFGEWRKLRDKSGPDAMQKMFTAIAKLDKDAAAGVWADLVGADFSDDFSKLRPEVLAEAFRLMADEQARAGSVAKEYATRSQTAANSLERLSNNIRAVGIAIGDVVSGDVGRGADRLATLIGSLTETTDNVFSRIRRGYDSLLEGLGGGGTGIFAGLKREFASLEEFIFGSGALPDDLALDERRQLLEESRSRMARLGEEFRKIGEGLGALGRFDLSGMRDLGEGLRSLMDSLGLAGSVAVALGVSALTKIAAGLGRIGLALLLSWPGRLMAAGAAIAELVEAIRSAGSVGEGLQKIVKALSDPWVLGATAITLWGIARALRAVASAGRGVGRIFGAGAAGAAAGAAAAGTGKGAKASPTAEAPASKAKPGIGSAAGAAARGAGWAGLAFLAKDLAEIGYRIADGFGSALERQGVLTRPELDTSGKPAGPAPNPLGTLPQQEGAPSGVPDGDAILRQLEEALNSRAAPPAPAAPDVNMRLDGAFDQFATDATTATADANAKLAEVAERANIRGTVNLDLASLERAVGLMNQLKTGLPGLLTLTNQVGNSLAGALARSRATNLQDRPAQ